MKKSKIKWEIKQSMKGFYKKGLTATAARVQKEMLDRIDNLYKKGR